MRIVGRYDYWDSAAASFGRDETITLVKDIDPPKEVVATKDLGRNCKPGLTVSLREAFNPPPVLPGIVLRNADKILHPNLVGVVFVGESIYPFYSRVVVDRTEKTTYTNYYTKEALKRAFPEWFEHEHRNIFSWWRGQASRTPSTFFDSTGEFIGFNILEFMIENKAAFAIMTVNAKGEFTCSLNPSWLDKIGFASVLDPYQMYQEIERFQTGVLTNHPEMVELSDKSRILKAGFDLKKSFRKEKE